MTDVAESAGRWNELATKFQSLADAPSGWQLHADAFRNQNESQDVLNWVVGGTVSDTIAERFELYGTEAACTIGISMIEVSLLHLWLHHLWQYVCDRSRSHRRDCLTTSYTNDGEAVIAESPSIHEVCKASAKFCLNAQRQVLESAKSRKTLTQHFQAWIVENESAPESMYWTSMRSMREWISLVARFASTPIPIDFLSDRLNTHRIPHSPAEFGSLRAFFDQVAREEGLIWCITERGLWIATQPPSAGQYMDANGRQHGDVSSIGNLAWNSAGETNHENPIEAVSGSVSGTPLSDRKIRFEAQNNYQLILGCSREYKLTAHAANVVKALHEAAKRNHGLTAAQIRHITRGGRVWDAFRSQDGRDFKSDFIDTSTKGYYKLKI